ncbi:FAD-binding and (Fe-S)-binding domain-containing protein [Devosia neptuniae]|jgi:D-lactate dehydrogenase|uniref:FAD-binding and (Fe-S)-binding domain-containing protein n=1 Tax=Devosia TaxID=46913 RepID=UPI0022AEB7F0|nr:FAD-binding and (Fe-S)-binding domain-containing protein [Devosia neptuniae]MCZ4347864.1 FAD-binding and (Fe-S)-binding domain-containing protein [Devosia neptuniae]|tara:strand:+ start:2806 stop:5739 length:2934 start_codon:yes stop_codon:yes gene_type:complete
MQQADLRPAPKSPVHKVTPDRQAAGERLVARLKGQVAGRMYTDPLMTYAWSGDASSYRLIPAAVVFINSEDEVRAVMAAARAENLPITFRAAGTSLSGQAVTDGVLAVLGDGWRKLDIHPGAEQITLGPAIIVANANKALKPFDKKIGPDPASQATCKIGGVVNNNSSGMCCGVAQNTYHTMARLRIVLTDGTMLDSGDQASCDAFRASHASMLEGLHQLHHEVAGDAELVALIRKKYAIKNTVGYSLNALIDFHDPLDILIHLMVGSEGTLGFVSEVTYNTVPEHPFKSTALVPFPDPQSAGRAIIEMANGGVQVTTGVTAAEYIERRALATVEHLAPMAPLLPWLTDNSPAVLIDVTAPDSDTLEAEVAKAVELLSRHGATHVDFSTDEARSHALWDIRKGFFASGGAARPKGTAMLTEDVAAPIERLAEFVIDMRQLLDDHGYDDAIIFGHALAGNLHFQMSDDFSHPDAAARFDAFSKALSDLVSVAYGGSLKAEHGTGRAIAAFVEAEWGSTAYALMHRIKALFDPEGLLNPGVLLNPDDKIHIKNLKVMPLADELVDMCIECGFCEPACPSHQMTLSPRQRIAVTRERARLRATGEDPERLRKLDEDFQYPGLDTCAACNLCSVRCPVGIETGTMIMDQRAQRRGDTARSIAGFVADHRGGVETLMRAGVGLADAARVVIPAAAVETMTEGARRLTGKRIPRVSHALHAGPGAPQPRQSRQDPRQAGFPVPIAQSGRQSIVYFPSCATRMFGAPKTDHGLLSVPDAMLALLERAGFDVIMPEHLNGQCCGQPFQSKGFPEQAASVGSELKRELSSLSDAGRLSVVTDASTCAKHLREFPGDAPVLDSSQFMLSHILSGLTITQKLPTVAVHHNCSAQRLAEQPMTEAIARACADNIAVLSSVTCCGYAGDKGLFVPELNAHATRFAKQDIPSGCTLGVSTVSTCASGLSEHTQVPFVGLASLLEWASRPLH